MSDDNFVKARRGSDGRLEQVLPDGSTRPLEGKSDWARVDAMTEEEIEKRSAATIAARRADAVEQGLYFRVWRHLCQKGLTAPSGDRAALQEELHRLR